MTTNDKNLPMRVAQLSINDHYPHAADLWGRATTANGSLDTFF